MGNQDMIWGETRQLQEIKDDLEKLAPSKTTLLVVGPTGSGKEELARYIHYRSGVTGPFVPINCAAIPDNLLESLLFGHERGIFTGAFMRHIGLFEKAATGTIFLDEIGCLSKHLQAKLLRVLQEMEFTRLGGYECLPLKARIISATNVNLERAVAVREFREDLYYRLATAPIQLPSLKSRFDDLPLFVRSFLERACEKMNKPKMKIPRCLFRQLKAYSWPGNIRELKANIELGVLRAHSNIFDINLFSPKIRKVAEGVCDAEETYTDGMLYGGSPLELPRGGIREFLKGVEKSVMIQILKKHRGIVNRAFRELELPKPTLLNRARILEIDIHKIRYEALKKEQSKVF